MKKGLLTVFCIVFTIHAFSKSINFKTGGVANKAVFIDTPNVQISSSGNLKPSRFALVFGVGLGYVTNPIYQDLVVSKTDNIVYVERADHFRTNLSIGFTYDLSKEITENGFCIGFLFNPVEITSINATKTSQFDFGLGIGYKIRGLSVMLTGDFFSIRQPKRYMITNFKENNNTYKVNGVAQTSIDINDNSVYRNKMVNSIGLKIIVPLTTFKTLFTFSKA